jgi:outer membrane protein assembly factor BamD (BamD/ComL family)
VKKLIMMAAICCIFGCASTTPHQVMTGPEIEYRAAAAFMKDKRFNDAIVIYRKIMDEAPDSIVAADARYQVALLHAIHDNPQRDYVRSIQEFDEFLKLHPADSKVPEAWNWIAVLTIIQDLKKENDLLKKDNDQLRKNIEELKLLDIRHEERRKGK